MVLPSPKSSSTKGFNHSSGLFIFLVPVPCSQSTSLLVTAALQLISQPDSLSVTFSWLCFPCSSSSNVHSVWCDAGLECETHLVLLWDKKVFNFYREVSALLFSLCFLPRKKGLKLEVCRDQEITPAWRCKAEFCSLCSPILFSGLLCPILPFAWIWLPSGQAFYSPLPHGIACLCICTDSSADQFSF